VRVGLLHARSGALTRLRLGRGRPRGNLGRQAAPVLRDRAVERRRPDSEGAPLRAHQQRRQPRRGREGVLLLSRLDADAFLHEVALQVPAARLPVRRPRETNHARSRNELEYELIDTGIFDADRYFDVVVEYAKATPCEILVKISAVNRGPDAATLHLLPTLWFRRTWSAGEDDSRPRLEVATAAPGTSA